MLKLLVRKYLQFLSYQNENPSLVGAGKFGMDDIYKSWVQYCKHWKNLGRPKLYFVKTDITNCYDSILQDKLYSILEHVFQQVRNKKYSTHNFFWSC